VSHRSCAQRGAARGGDLTLVRAEQMPAQRIRCARLLGQDTKAQIVVETHLARAPLGALRQILSGPFVDALPFRVGESG
jgi:hypothetical protein